MLEVVIAPLSGFEDVLTTIVHPFIYQRTATLAASHSAGKGAGKSLADVSSSDTSAESLNSSAGVPRPPLTITPIHKLSLGSANSILSHHSG